MSLPATIGRYHVVGHLATGGMAEILLAKVFGPGGFEQAVVLKRILPHLARQESFAGMFLDEALIVARIRHPNVVRVQELGKEGAELFLVMEYLEGESLHGVMRRLASRDRRLEYGLCAHVIAEACAGLHAAHEMKDVDGNPQNLVHRDVSPQNVFVTYGGEVKLLDFGVAKASDRITRTEAGQVKGKYAYMSPEQVNGGEVDRRSDLFALGAVLYELSTERRLFQRATEMLTMQAVTERPIRLPSDVVGGYPKPLEAVVMRALERDPAKRYQTAAEMRLELLAVQRELEGTLAPDAELAGRMAELFSDRIGEKRELLRRLRAGSDVTHVPEAEVDLEVELPSVVHDREEPTGPTVSAIERPARRARWAIAAAAVVLLGGLGAALAIFTGGTSGGAAEIAGRGEREATESARAAGDEPSEANRVASEGGAGEARETVTLEVEARPEGAVVFVDGENRGRAPVSIAVPRGERVLIEARRSGYRPATERVVATADDRVLLRLRPRPRAAAAPEGEVEAPTEIERFH